MVSSTVTRLETYLTQSPGPFLSQLAQDVCELLLIHEYIRGLGVLNDFSM